MATQIDLFGPICYPMVNPFLDFMSHRLREGDEEFVISISSGGGEVFCGLSAYNFLRGCGAKIRTHNAGHVHSIAGAIFCAGTDRLCTPSSRFMIHDISWGIQEGRYSETQLREFLDGLRGDRTSVASVLSEAMSKTTPDVEKMMVEGKTLHAPEAEAIGLVTHVSQDIFDKSEPIHRFRID